MGDSRLFGTFASAGRRYGVLRPGEPRAIDYESIAAMRADAWRDTGWRGDVLLAQLLLWTAGESAENIRVTSGDLASGEARIPACCLEVRPLHYVRASMGRARPDAPAELVPDVIGSEPLEPFDMPAGSVQPLWISLRIPRDAVPGRYEGEICVASDGQTPLCFSVVAEVLAHMQPAPEESRFYLDLWQYPYAVARCYGVSPWSQEHFAYLEGQMRLLLDAGGGAITATIVENPWTDELGKYPQQTYDAYPSMVRWVKRTDGGWNFDFSIFDRWVQFCLDLGFARHIDCYSILPWNNRITYYDEAVGGAVTVSPVPAEDGEWRALWLPMLTAFVSHLEEKGWLGFAYIALDERRLPWMAAAVELVKGIKGKSGQSLKLTGAMNYGAVDAAILDRVENVSVNIAHIQHDSFDAFVRQRKALGLCTTLYACTGNYPNSFTRSQPIESAWLIWYTQKYGTDGFLRWAYDAWVERPLSCTDHWYWESGDAFQVYPAPEGGCVPQSSPRFELLRQGIRDVEKLFWLEKAAPEAAVRVRKLCTQLSLYPGKTNAWGAQEGAGHDEEIEADVQRLREAVLSFV